MTQSVHMVWSLIKAFFLALAGLPVTLIGFPLVALGLPFRKSSPRPLSRYPVPEALTLDAR